MLVQGSSRETLVRGAGGALGGEEEADIRGLQPAESDVRVPASRYDGMSELRSVCEKTSRCEDDGRIDRWFSDVFVERKT